MQTNGNNKMDELRQDLQDVGKRSNAAKDRISKIVDIEKERLRILKLRAEVLSRHPNSGE